VLVHQLSYNWNANNHLRDASGEPLEEMRLRRCFKVTVHNECHIKHTLDTFSQAQSTAIASPI